MAVVHPPKPEPIAAIMDHDNPTNVVAFSKYASSDTNIGIIACLTGS